MVMGGLRHELPSREDSRAEVKGRCVMSEPCLFCGSTEGPIHCCGKVVFEPGEQSDSEWAICPYCGAKYGDCWEWLTSETPEEKECHRCGRKFRAWAEFDVTYNTEPIAEPSWCYGPVELPGHKCAKRAGHDGPCNVFTAGEPKAVKP